MNSQQQLYNGNPTNLSEAQAKGRTANVRASEAFGKRMMTTIGKLIATGMSMNAVASELNGMSVPTMRGGRWTAKAVSRVTGSTSCGKGPSISVQPTSQ